MAEEMVCPCLSLLALVPSYHCKMHPDGLLPAIPVLTAATCRGATVRPLLGGPRPHRHRHCHNAGPALPPACGDRPALHTGIPRHSAISAGSPVPPNPSANCSGEGGMPGGGITRMLLLTCPGSPPAKVYAQSLVLLGMPLTFRCGACCRTHPVAGGSSTCPTPSPSLRHPASPRGSLTVTDKDQQAALPPSQPLQRFQYLAAIPWSLDPGQIVETHILCPPPLRPRLRSRSLLCATWHRLVP